MARICNSRIALSRKVATRRPHAKSASSCSTPPRHLATFTLRTPGSGPPITIWRTQPTCKFPSTTVVACSFSLAALSGSGAHPQSTRSSTTTSSTACSPSSPVSCSPRRPTTSLCPWCPHLSPTTARMTTLPSLTIAPIGHGMWALSDQRLRLCHREVRRLLGRQATLR